MKQRKQIKQKTEKEMNAPVVQKVDSAQYPRDKSLSSG